jgi:hypothetical protein
VHFVSVLEFNSIPVLSLCPESCLFRRLGGARRGGSGLPHPDPRPCWIRCGRFLKEVDPLVYSLDIKLLNSGPTCQNVLESKLDVAGIEGRSFNKRQVVFT